MSDISQFVSVSYFAQAHGVPLSAVNNAIDLHRLKLAEVKVNGEPALSASMLVDYKFELISIYDYAERKGITPMAVYKRTISKKLPILFSVDEKSDTIKIDWELYKDEKFRAITMRFRKNKSVA